MSTFKTLTDAQKTKLAAVTQLTGVAVVVEDSRDLLTEISKALGELGAIVLLGVPRFTNQTKTGGAVVALIEQQVLISEMPALWRNSADTKPHCSVIAQMVAQALHGFNVSGFLRLRVKSGEPIADSRTDPKFQYYRLDLETTQTLNPL